MLSNPLWKYFIKGEKQNTAHYFTYCSFCVKHFKSAVAEEYRDKLKDADDVEKLELHKEWYESACHASGTVRGEKNMFIAHILGSVVSKQVKSCKYASLDPKTDAKSLRDAETTKSTPKRAALSGTKRKLAELSETSQASSTTPPASTNQKKRSELTTYNALNMPFSKEETHAVQAQALRAIISTKSPETLFEDPEMLKLFGMIRKESSAVIPSAKIVGGRLLNDAADTVDTKLKRILNGRNIGLGEGPL